MRDGKSRKGREDESDELRWDEEEGPHARKKWRPCGGSENRAGKPLQPGLIQAAKSPCVKLSLGAAAGSSPCSVGFSRQGKRAGPYMAFQRCPSQSICAPFLSLFICPLHVFPAPFSLLVWPRRTRRGLPLLAHLDTGARRHGVSRRLLGKTLKPNRVSPCRETMVDKWKAAQARYWLGSVGESSKQAGPEDWERWSEWFMNKFGRRLNPVVADGKLAAFRGHVVSTRILPVHIQRLTRDPMNSLISEVLVAYHQCSHEFSSFPTLRPRSHREFAVNLFCFRDGHLAPCFVASG